MVSFEFALTFETIMQLAPWMISHFLSLTTWLTLLVILNACRSWMNFSRYNQIKLYSMIKIIHCWGHRREYSAIQLLLTPWRMSRPPISMPWAPPLAITYAKLYNVILTTLLSKVIVNKTISMTWKQCLISCCLIS